MPRLLPLLLLLGAPVAASAQAVPDTTAPWRYLPLALGNRWEYAVYSSPDGTAPPTLSHYIREAITAEAVVNGERYFALTMEGYTLGGVREGVSAAFVRFDTARAQVVEIDGDPWYATPCRLDVPFGTYFPCPGAYHVGGGYGYVEMGVTTSVKEISPTSEDRIVLAAGIGRTRYIGDVLDPAGWSSHLRYARVGGAQYGTPISALPPPVAGEPGPPPERAALTVAPNPTAGVTSVRLTLAGGGAGHVAVYDVLGREVVALRRGPLGAGEHALLLDASALPVGVYVVRAVWGSGAASARMVVAR